MYRRCGLQIFPQPFPQKNKRLNLYMFNVIYMRHVPCVVTSRAQLFSHCGSFDHPCAVAKWLPFFLFFFYNCNFEIYGVFIIMLERYSQDLSNGIVQAHKFQTFKLVDTKMKFALEFLSSRCPTFVWWNMWELVKGIGQGRSGMPLGLWSDQWNILHNKQYST